MTRTKPVISTIEGCVGHLILKRSGALNALNLEMCELLNQQLLAWLEAPEIELVVISHHPEGRGFCAGGDIAMLAASGADDGVAANHFFRTEYRLNDLISQYPKPIVTIMDGVTMGGGVGLSIHATYQVATERTVFAMPETGIGLFPDVGGTWFLPRLEGEIGTWLALTGVRLEGKDVLAVGLATHYCASERVAALKSDLARRGIAALASHECTAEFSQARHLPELNAAFSGNCVKQIIKKLNRGSPWAQEQARRLNAKSPLSSKVALRQMRTGPFLSSLREALRIEYRIARRMVSTVNFKEGVRATVIDKDHLPRWYPRAFHLATYDHVSKFFTPIGMQELSFPEYDI